MAGRVFTVCITEDPEGGYTARCLEVNAFSQGDTKEEVLANIREAIACECVDEQLENIPRSYPAYLKRVKVACG